MARIEYAIDGADWAPDDDRRAAALITLDRVRAELRIPDGDDGHDALLRQLAESAASAIIADTRIPALPARAYAQIVQRDPGGALDTGEIDSFILEITAVRYARPGMAAHRMYWPVLATGWSQLSPDEALTGQPVAGRALAIPPADGWPKSLGDSYGVFYDRGLLQGDSRLGMLTSMMVLRIREEYGGAASVPQVGRDAYDRHVGRIKNFSLQPRYVELP